jgi:hypothetical protein
MNSANAKQCLWVLLIITLVLTVLVATSTTLAPMSFADLTQRATAIAHLRCVSVHSTWANGEIWTVSRFDVLEQVKPDAYGLADDGTAVEKVARLGQTPGGQIAVRQLGGSVGGVHSHVDDVPAFQPGEEVYLFLWRRAGEPYRVLGWTQGTFRIVRDARAGGAHVTQDSAIGVFNANTREFQRSGVHNMPLAVFQEKLRQSVAASQR